MGKIRVADYIVKQLVEYGVHHVFMVTGGGAMHLNDAVGRNKKVTYICNHHEQACSIAAEGYARSTGELAVVFTTSGPGGLNTLTGVLGQWTDSVPVLYISGQVKYETTTDSCRSIGLRQLGDQEADIISVVKPLTKYAQLLKDPLDIKRILHKALLNATSGRPGPVWLDIPLNVQGAVVDENDLYQIESKENNTNSLLPITDEMFAAITKAIFSSKRPLIIVGHGIRISHSETLFNNFINILKIPVVTTFNGFDLLPDEHPLYIGRIGTLGQRAGNFALQNADLIICLGTRNNIRQVSYNWNSFAKRAKKIVIDIDSAELQKPTVTPDIAVNADVKVFLEKCEIDLIGPFGKNWMDWIAWCRERSRRYPVVLSEYKTTEKINPYYFTQILTENLDENATVVCGNGSACVCMFQAGVVKKNQRIFWNSGCASMGYDLPASIGACFGRQRKPVICIAGEGSLMMNLQELQTVRHFNLPIKIFVLNNGGYQSIKQTQDSFFGLPFIGCDRSSGVSFPDFMKLANAFNIEGVTIQHLSEIQEKINLVLSNNDPILCEVILSQEYIFSPKLSSKRHPDGTITSPSLEDMFPFLKPEELKENMID